MPVPYALSDIDLVAVHPHSQPFKLPDGSPIGPRVIVESKDEHDWEPTGREFGKHLRSDMALIGAGKFIPRGTKGAKFTMLREEHFVVATELFDTDDFDRLFVVHALDDTTRQDVASSLKASRVHWITAREMIRDLEQWYRGHPRATGLRNTLVGDLLHLFMGLLRDAPAGQALIDF